MFFLTGGAIFIIIKPVRKTYTEVFMKKLFFVALSIILTMTFALSSFAYFGMNDFEPIGDVDQVAEGLSLNSNEGSYSSGDYITTRNDWTPNRAEDPDRTNAIFVNGVEGNDGNCIKVTRSFTLFPDSAFTGDFYVAADIKPVKVTSFTGFLFDYTDGSNSSTDTPHPNATIAERVKEHDYEYILYTGYGVTFIADKPTVIRAFVNASKTGTVDYVDIELGFDTTAGWHNYAMYEDTAAKKTYFYVDGVLKAYFDFTQDDGAIYNGLGETICSGTNNFFGNQQACLSIIGDDVEVYFDNLVVDNWAELPKSAAPAFKGASFDTILINGEMASFQTADGNASAALDTVSRKVDGINTKVKTITLRGWAGFESEIEAFGYKIGNDKPVFGEFTAETSEDVKAAGGEYASRFEIVIPFDTVFGTQKVVAVVKFANGVAVELTPEEIEGCPDTSFTYAGVSTEIYDYADSGHGRCFDSTKVYDKEGTELEDYDSDALGEISKLSVAGWVGYNEDYIEKFGYVIDSEEPVWTGSKTEVSADDPVRAEANGGEMAARFKITYEYKEGSLYDGEHALTFVAKLMNGEVYAVSEDYFFEVTGNPAPSQDPSEETATAEPADPTAEPEDPAEPTEAASETTAPETTEEPKAEKKGCGGFVSAGAIVAMAAAFIVIRKKN